MVDACVMPVPVPAAAPRRRVSDTSMTALQGLEPRRLSEKRQRILDVVLACHRNGARDLTRQEIRQACELAYQQRFETSDIAARVNELIRGQWLQERAQRRGCNVTGNEVRAVYVPEQQARLCA